MSLTIITIGGQVMKKNLYRMYMLIALAILPMSAFASYNGCMRAGGNFFSCFWGAAMNDRIAAPQEGEGVDKAEVKFSEEQIKKSFAENSEYCSSVPIDEQYACLSKGMAVAQPKVVNTISVKPTNQLMKQQIQMSPQINQRMQISK